CPMCGQRLNSDNYETVQMHVNSHFPPSPVKNGGSGSGGNGASSSSSSYSNRNVVDDGEVEIVVGQYGIGYNGDSDATRQRRNNNNANQDSVNMEGIINNHIPSSSAFVSHNTSYNSSSLSQQQQQQHTQQQQQCHHHHQNNNHRPSSSSSSCSSNSSYFSGASTSSSCSSCESGSSSVSNRSDSSASGASSGSSSMNGGFGGDGAGGGSDIADLVECPWDHCRQWITKVELRNHAGLHKAEELQSQELEAAAMEERRAFEELKRKEREDSEGAVGNESANTSSEGYSAKRHKPNSLYPTNSNSTTTTTTTTTTNSGGVGDKRFKEEGDKNELLRNLKKMVARGKISATESMQMEARIRSGDEDAYPSVKKSFTAGVVPALQRLLRVSMGGSGSGGGGKGAGKSGQGNGQGGQRTVKAYLCHPGVLHFRTDLFDLNWGCGYRNVQMLLSALLSQEPYSETLRSNMADMRERLHRNNDAADDIPSIGLMQDLIEHGWSEGVDVEGSEQLKNTLKNTRKWIGPSEVSVMFQVLDVRLRLIDFPSWTGPDKSHPAILDLVEAYFDDSMDSFFQTRSHKMGYPAPFERKRKEGVHVTSKPPLYFQHSGHSRTIVGLEVTNDQRNLIVFDPGKNIPPNLPLNIASSSAIESNQNNGNNRNGSSSSGSTQSGTAKPFTTVNPQQKTLAPIFNKFFTGGVSSGTGGRSGSGGGSGGNAGSSTSSSSLGIPTYTEAQKLLKPFRVTPKQLSTHSQYQMAEVVGIGWRSEKEREAAKVLTSLRIE
ncbi:hypothetical protein HDU76_005101, partial [Blyttiomyces sp. JEL0837]